ncbi:hypothetical protein RhiirA1_470280 [Rhizophagus irregularis]|uniref:Uncharacterized protein n=1 Tax=Rhizophagus irregularis TaxID=588596 RepID=A0A2N0R6G3_9GLOM|nr:hypothetical protein RhiirA1_470280 [Rhizophagus irregularis]
MSDDDLFRQDEKEEEIDENEREIVNINSDSADELNEFFFGKSRGGAKIQVVLKNGRIRYI